jgi:hypothetical protein
MVDTHPGDGGAAKLRAYWTHGAGAAKIAWGTPGDFARCVANLTPYFPKDPKGLCANLHHEALGAWPGRE